MTTYRDPRAVQGPKNRVSGVRVVYDGGPGNGAVAQLDWDGEPAVGLRWNGNLDDQPLGQPQSRGNPVWLRVPPELEEAVLERARQLAPESEQAAAYRAMAADTERETAALDWSNALIGDGSVDGSGDGIGDGNRAAG